MKRTVFIFVFGLLLFSCMDSDDLSLASGPVPVGTWSNIEYQTNGCAMERVSQLKENKRGYRFLNNGKLIHRSNSDWCGTPPIVTKDFEGVWKIGGDTITVRSRFWGGINVQEWKISETSGNRLQVEIVSTEWKMDGGNPG
jgi:hypothetical protein